MFSPLTLRAYYITNVSALVVGKFKDKLTVRVYFSANNTDALLTLVAFIALYTLDTLLALVAFISLIAFCTYNKAKIKL